jgi:hypothetical protein
MVPAVLVLVDLDCLYQVEAGILQRFTPPSATRAYYYYYYLFIYFIFVNN